MESGTVPIMEPVLVPTFGYPFWAHFWRHDPPSEKYCSGEGVAAFGALCGTHFRVPRNRQFAYLHSEALCA